MYKWLEPQTFALWLGLAFLFVLVLVLGMVWVAYTGVKRISAIKLDEARMQLAHQKKLLETAIQVQEDERTRIAADLHDTLIGRLAAIRIGLRLPGQAHETDRLLEESIAEARRISHNLHVPFIEHRPLHEFVQDMLLPLEARFAVSFTQGAYTSPELPANIKVQAIRIMQELLANTLRHSQASGVHVHIRSGRLLQLSLRDDGCGFNPHSTSKGIGLRNIELRTQYLQATYRIKSRPGKGTYTLIVIPLNPHNV